VKTPYVLTTLADALPLLNLEEPLFTDTETKGFYQEIRLLQVYQPHLDKVLLVDHPGAIQTAAFLDKFTTVWHNSHYDITTVQQQSGTRWVPKNYEDTFLLARLHFFTKEKFSLDETFQYVLGYCPYVRQNLDKKALQKSDWAKLALTEDQLLYAATDVYYMPQLWEAVKSFVSDQSYQLDKLTLGYCFDFQWNGMPLNKDALFFRYQDNEQLISDINLPINANSYKQVREWLGGITESDALALTKLSLEGNTKAHQILQVRRLRKQNSFLDKFDTEDGRIYGKFLPSARSGRLTSKDQNLQQLPRKLKAMFEAPPGRVLIYADYAQLELRTICAITACRAMEKLFRSGADLHGFTAQMLFGDDWTKDDRNLSKTYNFSFLLIT
jgi:DNA polymerase I-like protein with 3'-5' exonuclease and polymerase domains